jgi:hypothetical protein
MNAERRWTVNREWKRPVASRKASRPSDRNTKQLTGTTRKGQWSAGNLSTRPIPKNFYGDRARPIQAWRSWEHGALV